MVHTVRALVGARVSSVQRAGWAEVETDQTYGEMWPDASPDDRREMLRGRVAVVVGRDGVSIYRDLEKLLGEGPSGDEVLAAVLARTPPG